MMASGAGYRPQNFFSRPRTRTVGAYSPGDTLGSRARMPMEDLLNAEHTELRMMEDERLIGLSPVSTNPLRQVINVYRFYSNDNLFNCIWCASRVEHHPNTISFWPSVVATASPKMISQ